MTLGYDGFLPTTAQAAVEILKRSGIQIAGKRAVVIGRSNVVGKPAAILLLREHATVTVCHSRTRDLPALVKSGRDRRRRGRQAGPGHRRRCSGAGPSSSTSGSTSWAIGSWATSTSRARARSRLRDHAGAGRRGARDECPAPDPRHAGGQRAAAGCRRAVDRLAGEPPGASGERDESGSVRPRDRPVGQAAADRRGRPRAGPAGRRGRALRLDQGQGHARGHPPARGDQPARQVRRRHRDHARRPSGEGKTTTTIGLAQGLNRIGKRAAVAIRQPSAWARSSGSRAARPAAATARSSRWRTSTST